MTHKPISLRLSHSALAIAGLLAAALASFTPLNAAQAAAPASVAGSR
jgi:hypothetical protein